MKNKTKISSTELNFEEVRNILLKISTKFSKEDKLRKVQDIVHELLDILERLERSKELEQ